MDEAEPASRSKMMKWNRSHTWDELLEVGQFASCFKSTVFLREIDEGCNDMGKRSNYHISISADGWRVICWFQCHVGPRVVVCPMLCTCRSTAHTLYSWVWAFQTCRPVLRLDLTSALSRVVGAWGEGEQMHFPCSHLLQRDSALLWSHLQVS